MTAYPTPPNPTSTNPIEDDFSIYYTFFQQQDEEDDDDDNNNIAPPPPPPQVPKKLPNTKKCSLTKLLTSLGALKSQHESDHRQSYDASRRHLSLLQSNLRLQSHAALSVSSHLDSSSDDLDASHLAHAQFARLASAAMAAAASADSSSSSSSVAAVVVGQQRLWVKDRSHN